MTIDTTTGATRELAQRVSDGIEVTLYWNSDSGRLTVVLSDERTAEHFEIEAARENALDVFHHPYAYADLQKDELEPELLLGEFVRAAE